MSHGGERDGSHWVSFGGDGCSGHFDLLRGLKDIVLAGAPPLSVQDDAAAGARSWLSVELLGAGDGRIDVFEWAPAPWPAFARSIPADRRRGAFRGTGARAGTADETVVATVCAYTLRQDYLGIRIAVHNRTRQIVHRVAVEAIRGLRLGPGWHLSIPTCGGWAVRAEDFPSGFGVSLRYPVKGSLQWLEVFSRDAGVSFGTLDPVPWIKDFTLRRSGETFGVGVSHPYLDLAAGQKLVLPPVYLGLHQGGWECGARWYRQWLETVVHRQKAPRWLLERPVWSWVSMKKQYAAQADVPYSELPACSESLGKLGLPLIQVAAWFEHGHDTRYPDYVAGASLGGEDHLVQAVKHIHSSGRFIALYTNGRIVDPQSTTLASCPEWNEWLVRAPSGRRYRDFQGREVTGIDIDVPPQEWDPEDVRAKERYGEVTFGVMCPSVRKWQRVFSRRLHYLARAYGVDGIYIDQVLGAIALPCYAANHGHRTPREAWCGYHRLLRTVRRKVRAARPQAYLATEGVSDILSQYFDIVQSHNEWRGEAPEKAFPMPELLRHAMPALLQASGPVFDGNHFLLRLAHSAGSGLDIACRSVDPDSDFGVRLRAVASWRTRFGKDYLQGDPLPCEAVEFPRHRATAIQEGMRIFLFTADLAVTEQPIPMEVRIAGARGGEMHPVIWEDERAGQMSREGPALCPPAVRRLNDGSYSLVLAAHEMGFMVAELQ